METQSPYAPPASDVAINEIKFGKPWKGVLLGVLTDMGGTLVFGSLIGVAYGLFMASHGMSSEEVTRMLAQPQGDAVVTGIGYGVGSLFSALGGYVCARIVRRKELQWGLLTGLTSAVLGTLLFGTAEGAGMELLGYALTFGAVTLGAWLAQRKNRRELAAVGAA